MTKVEIALKNKSDNSDAFIQNEKDVEVRVRAPKRVLHFSDGTMEEFSDDDAEDQIDKAEPVPVDESKLKWSEWMRYKTCKFGSSVLAGCDYVGEGLASFLGITTPKYSYEIEEFKRMQAEKDEEENAIQNFVDRQKASQSAATVEAPTSTKSDPANSEVCVENEIQKF